jgi:hypothetical protein
MNGPESISELSELIGKSIVVGITRVDHKGEVVSQHQFHGRVDSLDDGLVHIRVADNGEDYTLPPDPEAFKRARPGEYRLRGTGEVVVNPDFTSTWTVQAPDPEKKSDDTQNEA